MYLNYGYLYHYYIASVGEVKMKTRIITGLIFGIVFLFFIVIGNAPLLVFCLVAATIGIYEYFQMLSKKPIKLIHTILAISYILCGFLSFHFLRASEGTVFIIYLLIVVWATDSFAYFTGRKFGKTKLAPSISPNKTWEGSIGGTLIATILAMIFNMIYTPFPGSLVIFIIITILLSIAGQLGDLIESYIKRFFGVKDSGKLLPGHGGILDRFDSLILVSIIAYIINIFV